MKKSFILIALCALTSVTFAATCPAKKVVKTVKAKPPGTKDTTCDPKLVGCRPNATGDRLSN